MSILRALNGVSGAAAIAGAGLWLAGPALAQTSGTGSGNVSTTTSSSRSDDGQNSISIVDSRDGKNVVIEIHNGDVTRAEYNGKAVPSERIERDGHTIKLKDESGAVVYSRELPTSPEPSPQRAPRAMAGRFQPLSIVPDGQGMTLRGWANQSQNQKSMIGVTLGSVDESLRRHFGLKPGEATMVYSVSQGLPADLAGINAYDIIVGIEGKSPANEEYVRATLREKDPGTPVSITVIQHGQTKTLSITPEKYDREKLEKTKHKQIAGAEGEDSMGQGAFAVAGPGMAPESMVLNLQGMAPDVQRSMEQAFANAKRWAYRVQTDGNGNVTVTTDPDQDADDEKDNDEDSDAAGAQGSAAAIAHLGHLLRKLPSGSPMVGTVVGPDGKPQPQVFVSGPDMEQWNRQMAEWSRAMAEQQRDMAERMRAMREQLREIQRAPRPTPPQPPVPPTPPVESPGSAGGQS